MTWTKVTAVENIPLREGRSVQLGPFSIAIFNLGDRFLAVQNQCPHGRGPLADGIVGSSGDSVTVTCPMHNWRVCLESGRVKKPGGTGAACVSTFPVRVEDGIVCLQLREGDEKAA